LCKSAGETVIHILLHSAIAYEL